MFAIIEVHERLMRSGLSERDADILIGQLLYDEAEDFLEITKAIDKKLNGSLFKYLKERQMS